MLALVCSAPKELSAAVGPWQLLIYYALAIKTRLMCVGFAQKVFFGPGGASFALSVEGYLTPSSAGAVGGTLATR